MSGEDVCPLQLSYPPSGEVLPSKTKVLGGAVSVDLLIYQNTQLTQRLLCLRKAQRLQEAETARLKDIIRVMLEDQQNDLEKTDHRLATPSQATPPQHVVGKEVEPSDNPGVAWQIQGECNRSMAECEKDLKDEVVDLETLDLNQGGRVYSRRSPKQRSSMKAKESRLLQLKKKDSLGTGSARLKRPLSGRSCMRNPKLESSNVLFSKIEEMSTEREDLLEQIKILESSIHRFRHSKGIHQVISPEDGPLKVNTFKTRVTSQPEAHGAFGDIEVEKLQTALEKAEKENASLRQIENELRTQLSCRVLSLKKSDLLFGFPLDLKLGIQGPGLEGEPPTDSSAAEAAAETERLKEEVQHMKKLAAVEKRRSREDLGVSEILSQLRMWREECSPPTVHSVKRKASEIEMGEHSQRPPCSNGATPLLDPYPSRTEWESQKGHTVHTVHTSKMSTSNSEQLSKENAELKSRLTVFAADSEELKKYCKKMKLSKSSLKDLLKKAEEEMKVSEKVGDTLSEEKAALKEELAVVEDEMSAAKQILSLMKLCCERLVFSNQALASENFAKKEEMTCLKHVILQLESEKAIWTERLETQSKRTVNDSSDVKAVPQGFSLELARLEAYEQKVKCPLCKIEEKSMLFAKCGHALCRSCADEGRRARNRKCPLCGLRFSDSEVLHIHLS